jgi:aspartate racemase
MKTIGIIGGISWHSTAEYYSRLNEMVNAKLGGVHSAKIILHSVDYEEIKQLTEAGRWDELLQMMCKAAVSMQAAGADCVLISANTMHKIADDVQAAINIPLIHIGIVTATAIKQQRLKKVALLGTKYTMQLDFYSAKLVAQGIDVMIPAGDDISFINHSIYNEFGAGIFLPATKQRYLEIINELILQGAEGIVLACTEIPILVQQQDCNVPVFDTGLIHVTAAVNFALNALKK